MSDAVSERVVTWVLDRNSRYRANWLTRRIFIWGVKFFIRRGKVTGVELVDTETGRRW